MLCSQVIWLRLSADLKSRRSSLELLSARLDKHLAKYQPALQEKMQRVMQVVRNSAPAFQLMVERASPLKFTEDAQVRELFAQADFEQAARTYHECRLALSHELQLWEVSDLDKRDAHVGMTLSLFRQCEALKDAQERALAFCQIQMWVEDGSLHYAGELETPAPIETESQS